MAKKQHIVRYSLDQIKAMIARGEDKTDWAAVDRKRGIDLESDIASDADSDIGESTQMWVRVPPGYRVRLVKKTA
jgi:hypothetical protein